MFRLGPDSAGRALDRPHVRPMDFTGRPGNPHRRPRIATAAAARLNHRRSVAEDLEFPQ